jgi:hypothetical protein
MMITLFSIDDVPEWRVVDLVPFIGLGDDFTLREMLILRTMDWDDYVDVAPVLDLVLCQDWEDYEDAKVKLSARLIDEGLVPVNGGVSGVFCILENVEHWDGELRDRLSNVLAVKPVYCNDPPEERKGQWYGCDSRWWRPDAIDYPEDWEGRDLDLVVK